LYLNTVTICNLNCRIIEGANNAIRILDSYRDLIANSLEEVTRNLDLGRD